MAFLGRFYYGIDGMGDSKNMEVKKENKKVLINMKDNNYCWGEGKEETRERLKRNRFIDLPVYPHSSETANARVIQDFSLLHSTPLRNSQNPNKPC